MTEQFTEVFERTPAIEAFWQRYAKAHAINHQKYDLVTFGASARSNDELLALALVGQKRATVSLAREFQVTGENPPSAGGFVVLLDSQRRPRAAWVTERVDCKPLSDATEEDAFIEGEGLRTLDDWREDFYQRAAQAEGWSFNPGMLAFFERFKIVYHEETNLAPFALVAVLHEAKAWANRRQNDFSFSYWGSPEGANEELDGHIEALLWGRPLKAAGLGAVFAPSGPLMELALSSGWGDKAAQLGARFDEVWESFTASG